MVGQSDFKRLLAYSSVEHMGILVLGLGLGGVGRYGARAPPGQQRAGQGGAVPGRRQHRPGYRHARRAADPRRAARAAGLGRAAPARALRGHGSPPFGLFLSEFTILSGGDRRRAPVDRGGDARAAGDHLRRHGGDRSSEMRLRPAPQPAPRRWRESRLAASAGPLALRGCASCCSGVYIPAPLHDVLARAADAPRGRGAMSGFDELGLRNRRRDPVGDRCRSSRWTRFRETVLAGGRADGWRLVVVLRHAGGGRRDVAWSRPGRRCARRSWARRARVVGDALSSRSRPTVPQAHLFEREIAEQCGVVPEGHPWLKPLRRHPPDHLAARAARRSRSTGRRIRSSGSRARKCTRSRSGRCTPASSSPGTSASRPRRGGALPRDHARLPAPRRRAAARDARARIAAVLVAESIAGDTVDRPRRRVLRCDRGAGAQPQDAAGADHPRDRARARAARQPHRRPRRASRATSRSSRRRRTSAGCGASA